VSERHDERRPSRRSHDDQFSRPDHPPRPAHQDVHSEQRTISLRDLQHRDERREGHRRPESVREKPKPERNLNELREMLAHIRPRPHKQNPPQQEQNKEGKGPQNLNPGEPVML